MKTLRGHLPSAASFFFSCLEMKPQKYHPDKQQDSVCEKASSRALLLQLPPHCQTSPCTSIHTMYIHHSLWLQYNARFSSSLAVFYRLIKIIVIPIFRAVFTPPRCSVSPQSSRRLIQSLFLVHSSSHSVQQDLMRLTAPGSSDQPNISELVDVKNAIDWKWRGLVAHRPRGGGARSRNTFICHLCKFFSVENCSRELNLSDLFQSRRR